MLQGSQVSSPRPTDKRNVNAGLETDAALFDFSELISNCIMWENNLVSLTTEGLNFDYFHLEGPQIAETELGNHLSFCSAG